MVQSALVLLTAVKYENLAEFLIRPVSPANYQQSGIKNSHKRIHHVRIVYLY